MKPRALVEPAGGYIDVENESGGEIYLWVAVDGHWPPLAREPQHRLPDRCGRRVGPGRAFEAIAQTVDEGDEASGSTPEELVPNATYAVVALNGKLSFDARGALSDADRQIPRGIRHMLTDEHLKKIRASKKPLGEMLIELGILSEKKLRENIAEQLGVPVLDLTPRFADPTVVATVAAKFCNDNKVLPLYKVGNRLIVAMVDPTDLEAIDGLQFLTGYKVDPVFVAGDDFQRTFGFFHA